MSENDIEPPETVVFGPWWSGSDIRIHLGGNVGEW
jgi:hypothetical protein